MARPKPNVPADKLVLYEKLVATRPEIPRKGAANPYTSLNGHMFSFLTREGKLALRLSPDEQAAFMKKHGTGPVISYGATMRGYVEVPDALLKKTAELKKVFDRSIAYIESLPPKPTTSRKKVVGKKKVVARKKVARKRK